MMYPRFLSAPYLKTQPKIDGFFSPRTENFLQHRYIQANCPAGCNKNCNACLNNPCEGYMEVECQVERLNLKKEYQGINQFSGKSIMRKFVYQQMIHSLGFSLLEFIRFLQKKFFSSKICSSYTQDFQNTKFRETPCMIQDIGGGTPTESQDNLSQENCRQFCYALIRKQFWQKKIMEKSMYSTTTLSLLIEPCPFKLFSQTVP